MQVAEAVRRRIAAQEPADGEPGATVSVGVALLDPSEDTSGLLRRADLALYSAKTGGRNVMKIAS